MKMKKNKLMYLTLFILAIAGIFLVFNNFLFKNTENREELKIYKNNIYNYRLLYPKNLIFDDSNASKVVFRDEFQYWYIDIGTEKTDYTDIKKWADFYIEDMEKSRGVVKVAIDKEISIDGNKALLFKTDYASNYEFTNDNTRRIFFIKNGYLYTFSTRQVDQQKIWDSFKFLK